MEKLICFQIENTREIERLASNMKIRVIKADASMYNEMLDSIVNGKISSVNSTFSASISPLVTENKLPADSILIFCDLSEKHESYAFRIKKPQSPNRFKGNSYAY